MNSFLTTIMCTFCITFLGCFDQTDDIRPIIDSSSSSLLSSSTDSNTASFESSTTHINNTLSHYFDIEGNLPYAESGLAFSALASQFLTQNGHGWRNECKKKSALRKNLYETNETLSASIQTFFSHGVKTIIIQYHDGGTGTLLKVYVADIANSKLINRVAHDAIFDIFVRYFDLDSIEKTVPMGTVVYGETFHLSLENRFGRITLHINDSTLNTQIIDAENVYLKFGNYLQAQDAQTGAQAEKENYDSFYRVNGITQDTILFSNIVYTSE